MVFINADLAKSAQYRVALGARYWNQELDLSLAVDASADLGNLGLKRSGSRAVARSGALEWVDPFVGSLKAGCSPVPDRISAGVDAQLVFFVN